MFKSIFSFFANFGKPDLLSMKVNELLEAEVNLLKSQSALEYANSMVIYNTGRVTRLTSDVQTHVKAIAEAKTSLKTDSDRVKFVTELVLKKPIEENSIN